MCVCVSVCLSACANNPRGDSIKFKLSLATNNGEIDQPKHIRYTITALAIDNNRSAAF